MTGATIRKWDFTLDRGNGLVERTVKGVPPMTTMTPARSSSFAAMARDPLHPDVIYRDERCFVVRDINPNGRRAC